MSFKPWPTRATKRIAPFLVFPLFLAASFTVVAQDDNLIMDKGLTREEFLELPRFCYVQRRLGPLPGITSELGEVTPELVNEGKKWSNMLGPGVWAALHHYCQGLARIARYRKSIDLGVGGHGDLTPRQRITLQHALGEFQFMQGYMERERSVLYPDWALNQAFTYRGFGEHEKAKERLLAAIVFKSDYEPAYLELASLLEEEGNRVEAIRILEIGLAKTSGSAVIRAKLDKVRSE